VLRRQVSHTCGTIRKQGLFKRQQGLHDTLLVEGNSMASTQRIEYQNQVLRMLPCTRLEIDGRAAAEARPSRPLQRSAKIQN